MFSLVVKVDDGPELFADMGSIVDLSGFLNRRRAGLGLPVLPKMVGVILCGQSTVRADRRVFSVEWQSTGKIDLFRYERRLPQRRKVKA